MLKQLVLFSSKGLKNSDDIYEVFSKSLDLRLPFISLKTTEEFHQHLAQYGSNSLWLMDASHEDKAAYEEVRALLREIIKLDTKSCVLILSSQQPTAQSVIEWLNDGATAVLEKSFTAENLGNALIEILRQKLTLKRIQPRIAARHRLKLEIASLEQAVVTETLNLGFGGFFASEIISGADVGDSIDFEFLEGVRELSGRINFEEKDLLAQIVDDDDPRTNRRDLRSLRGIGRIVWIRNGPSLANSEPNGMGVEFVELDEVARIRIQTFVKRRKQASFIPKS